LVFVIDVTKVGDGGPAAQNRQLALHMELSRLIAMRWSKFPCVVEIAGPLRGVRKVAMYDFHARLGIEAHPVLHEYSSRPGVSRWRFASLTDAEKFARQFGGSVVTGRPAH
jgi:hypothetical protein